jgi:hypothetical protein
MKTFKKIILEDLKAQNLDSIAKKIKSITLQTYSMGSTLHVSTSGLTDSERTTLKNVLEEYQDGHFNGMEDIYEYKKGAQKKERTAKYVNLQNTPEASL